MNIIVKKDIKVYVGGTESIQRSFFIPEKADYSDRATFDELSIEDLGIRKLTGKRSSMGFYIISDAATGVHK